MPAWFATPDGYNTHGQIAVLQEGRVIAFGKNILHKDTFFDGGNTCEVINVRVPDLRMVEYVLNVQFTWGTIECGDSVVAYNKKITGNVVGMTLSGDESTTGTTLTVEVIAIGPP